MAQIRTVSSGCVLVTDVTALLSCQWYNTTTLAVLPASALSPAPGTICTPTPEAPHTSPNIPGPPASRARVVLAKEAVILAHLDLIFQRCLQLKLGGLLNAPPA